jgi:hypothetical protein
MYFLLTYLLYAKSWAALERNFSSAWDTKSKQVKESKPCALTVNGHLIAEGTSNERFNLARPHVLVVEQGIVFLIRPNPLRMFRPILVRYDQVESFGHVRDNEGRWIEIEFSERGTHCWAHLPVTLASSLRAHGIAQGVPPYRLRPLLEEALDPARSATANLYVKTFACSTWVADLLETLDNRDLVDAYHDVDSLWGAVYEYHQQKTWGRASAILADRSTSYWLSAALRDAQSRPDANLLKDVQQLLVVVRNRMDHSLGSQSPLLHNFPRAPA